MNPAAFTDWLTQSLTHFLPSSLFHLFLFSFLLVFAPCCHFTILFAAENPKGISVRLNSIWFNLICFDLTWFDSIGFNSVVFNLRQFNSIQFDLVQFDLFRFNPILFDSIPFELFQFHSIPFVPIRFDSLWFDSIQLDTIRFNSMQLVSNSAEHPGLRLNHFQQAISKAGTLWLDRRPTTRKGAEPGGCKH